jgi:hypothetical protein
MGQPVNLNRFKKQKGRDEKETRVTENSVKFGRTKSQLVSEQKDRDLEGSRLDGIKREP